MSEKFKLILFLIYTIFYELLVWCLVVGAIYFLNWNEWTVLVGIFMSSAQLKPKHFGLNYKLNDTKSN